MQPAETVALTAYSYDNAGQIWGRTNNFVGDATYSGDLLYSVHERTSDTFEQIGITGGGVDTATLQEDGVRFGRWTLNLDGFRQRMVGGEPRFGNI